MKIKLHQSVKGQHQVGDTVEVGKQEGEWLVAYGYASWVTEEPKHEQPEQQAVDDSEASGKRSRSRRRATESDDNTE